MTTTIRGLGDLEGRIVVVIQRSEGEEPRARGWIAVVIQRSEGWEA